MGETYSLQVYCEHFWPFNLIGNFFTYNRCPVITKLRNAYYINVARRFVLRLFILYYYGIKSILLYYNNVSALPFTTLLHNVV